MGRRYTRYPYHHTSKAMMRFFVASAGNWAVEYMCKNCRRIDRTKAGVTRFCPCGKRISIPDNHPMHDRENEEAKIGKIVWLES
jgi:hypothetical protein